MNVLRVFSLLFVFLAVATAGRRRYDALLKSANVRKLVAEETLRVNRLIAAETGRDLPSTNAASRDRGYPVTMYDASYGNACGRKFFDPLDVVYVNKDKELISGDVPFAVGLCD